MKSRMKFCVRLDITANSWDTDPITEMTIYIKYDVCEIGNMILHIVANLLNLLNFRIRYFIISTIDVVLELPMLIQ